MELQVPHGGFVSAVGEQRSMAGALDGFGEAALILRAHTRHTARNDLAALGDEPRHQRGIAPIDLQRLVREEGIDLALAAAPSARTTATAASTIAIVAIAIIAIPIAIPVSTIAIPIATTTTSVRQDEITPYP